MQSVQLAQLTPASTQPRAASPPARPVKVRAAGRAARSAVTRSLARRESRLLLVAKLRIVGKLSIGCASGTTRSRAADRLAPPVDQAAHRRQAFARPAAAARARCARAGGVAAAGATAATAGATAAAAATPAPRASRALLARAERLENLVSSPEKARATDVAATRLQSAHRGRSSRRLSGATAGAAAPPAKSSVASTDSRRQSAIPRRRRFRGEPSAASSRLAARARASPDRAL